MTDSTSSVPAAISPAPTLPSPSAQLRLWPGVAILALQWLFMVGVRWLGQGTMLQFYGIFLGPAVGALLVILWWLFASKIGWLDRLLIPAACAALALATYPLLHSSFKEFWIAAVMINMLPVVTTAWVGWLLLTPWLSWPQRRAGLLVVFLLAWGYFTIVRFDGTDGAFAGQFEYRWRPTAEDLFLAELATTRRDAATPNLAPVAPVSGDWPSFRGPDRDSRKAGVRIATDWKQSPPRLVWKHRVGPGWSSFAAVGNRLYTQEQRGDDEVVVCYDAASGAELWTHKDVARFSEVIGGPGPRATPTFHEGKLYALGATGRLNCLDPASGSVLWAKDIAADAGAKLPQWGFSSSPLVVDGIVSVFAGGPGGKSVLGYNALTGELAWSSGEGIYSYCSTQLSRLCGVPQLLITTDAGLSAFDPKTGQVLWHYSWQIEEGMARVAQPTVLSDTDVLIGTFFGHGTRRIRVSREKESWKTEEVWSSKAIKPYFNDQVVHRGHLYGFDANFLCCINLEDGKMKWRERGYGNGQILLLPDQDLLLILTEKGEVALVAASADSRKELARIPAIEGKTWNHPVLAHGRLFVRNGEEAASFEVKEEAVQTVGK